MSEEEKKSRLSNPFAPPTTKSSEPYFNIFTSNQQSKSNVITTFPSSEHAQNLLPKPTGSIFGGSASSSQLFSPPRHLEKESFSNVPSPGSPSFDKKLPTSYRIPKLSPQSPKFSTRVSTQPHSLFGDHASVLSHTHPSALNPFSSLRESVVHRSSSSQSQITPKTQIAPDQRSANIGDLQNISHSHQDWPLPEGVSKPSFENTTNIFINKSSDACIPQIFAGDTFQASSESKEKSSLLESNKTPMFRALNPFNVSCPSKTEALKESSSLLSNNEPIAAKKVSQFLLNPKTEKMGEKSADLEISDLEKDKISKDLSEDNQTLNTLIAIDIPKDYLNRHILKRHFEKFGNVTKVVINSKSNQASIFFNDSVAAAEAKSKGQSIHPLLPKMKLLFRPQPTKKLETSGTLKAKSPPSLSKSSFSLKKPDAFSLKKTNKSPTRGLQDPFAQCCKPKSAFKSKESVTLIRSSLSPPSIVKPAGKNKQLQSERYSLSPIPKTKPKEIGSKSASRKESILKKSFNVLRGNKPITNRKKIGLEQSKVSSRATSPLPNKISSKSLNEKISQPAYSNEDKYQILEARDKLIRLKKTKISELSQAKYLSATCPDMCPEKERYARERQYDVSVYEMTDGELNHKLAVKKFSRSSADKDEPLPHELRSSRALKISMDYLICNVISLQDNQSTQIDIWYNYLWNRTRALRNDIMQQHLLDASAVSVLEKCLRFHIHCSYHLCEENLEMFDPKMNTEHLTKSLQSLKELYHDLAEKNIFFDSESEMRSYEILLNIYDGNIIFNYINFRDLVRNSKDVQFAISVLHSLQTNNYIKFFDLVPKASYLQACILHRHFYEVRHQAIKTILKAYNVPNNPQLLNLTKLGKMLGFIKKSDLMGFLEQHGLHADQNGDVLINKHRLTTEASVSSLSRTEMITYYPALISEIIQGGPLPLDPLVHYVPHNSFDENGYLKPSARDASDQNKSLSSLHDNDYDNLHTEELEMHLLHKMREMHTIHLMKKYFSKWAEFVQREKKVRYIQENRRSILAKKVVTLWKNKVNKVLTLRRAVDNIFLSRCFQKWKKYVEISREEKQLIRQVQYALQKQTARKYLHIWKLKTEYCKKLNMLDFYRKRLIARKYFRIWRFQARDSHNEKRASNFFQTQMLKYFFSKWKRWLNNEKDAKKIDHEAFPSIGGLFTVEEQNMFLDWNYKRDLSMNLSAKQFIQLNDSIQLNLKRHFIVNKLSDLIAWNTLQIKDHFQTDLDKSTNHINLLEKSFKLLLIVDDAIDLYFLEWIRIKFNLSNVEDISTPLHSSECLNSLQTGNYCHIIVKEIPLSSKLADVDGASAIVVAVHEDNILKAKDMLRPYSWMSSIILCWNCEELTCLEDVYCFNEDSLHEPSSSEKLLEVILNFWKGRDFGSIISKYNLSEFVSGILSREVLVPVCNLVAQKKEDDNSSNLPLFEVVKLYNTVILHLIKYINNVEIPKNNWPPSEIDSDNCFPSKSWNHNEKRLILHHLSNLYLPPFTIAPGVSYTKLVVEISKFLSLTIGDDNWGEDLKVEVSKLLSKAEEDFHWKKSTNSLGFPGYDIYHSVPWLDIFTSCIFYKLSLLPDMNIYLDPTKECISQALIKEWMTKIRLSFLQFNPLENTNVDEHLTTKRKANIAPEEEPFSKVKKVNIQFDEALVKEENESKDFLKTLHELLLSEQKENVLLKELYTKECNS